VNFTYSRFVSSPDPMELFVFIFWSSSQGPFALIAPNLDIRLLWWSPSKIMYCDFTWHSRWPPRLLIGRKLTIFENL